MESNVHPLSIECISLTIVCHHKRVSGSYLLLVTIFLNKYKVLSEEEVMEHSLEVLMVEWVVEVAVL